MGMSRYDELNEKYANYLETGRAEEAYNELLELERQGDGAAVAVLALFYEFGIVCEKNVPKAIFKYTKALECGCHEAAWELVRRYYYGVSVDDGIDEDKDKGLEIMKKGAAMGNASCTGVLAEHYALEEEDYPKTFEYALKAAKMGDSVGMYWAGICYDDGLGVSPDPGAACHWYREYLNYYPDNDKIMLRLAICLANPFDETRRPNGAMLNEAFYYASKAVEKGNVNAHVIVAWFYEQGEIVELDYDLAYKYLKIAADNGHEYAQRHLKAYRKNLFGNYYLPK